MEDGYKMVIEAERRVKKCKGKSRKNVKEFPGKMDGGEG